MHVYDAAAVARLERVYASPQVVEQRRRMRAILAARPGEVGLDIGCGVAYLACELAREVSPGGRITAIDNSDESIAASCARVAREGLDAVVDVRRGDATRLDFPDASFDFVTVAQVYCYVPDVVLALSEAARVLRPGGRLVILDSDWDLCVFESRDRALSRRIVAARSSVQFQHAHLPRELHRLLLATGLTVRDVQSYAMIETRHDPGSFGAGLIDPMVVGAKKAGVPAADVDSWAEDLRARTADGDWFFCLDRFLFAATKP
jgi:arsenite methyltransferase